MNYALFAESEYLIKDKLQKIVKDLEKKFSSEIIEYSGKDKDFHIENLLNDLNTMPFLTEHRIILLNNPAFLSAKGSLDDHQVSALEAYLKDPADFSSLIVYVDDFKVDNRKKATKLIRKHSELYEPDDLDDRMIEKIILKDLHDSGIELSHQANLELVKRVTPLFNNWSQELEKLKLFDKQYLEKEDIEALIAASEGDNIFDLVNGVLDKNLYTSLSVYRNLPASEREPIALIMLLANQFRLIHQVQTLANQSMANPQIASVLKVHPYRVKLARNLANRYRSKELLNVLNKLAQLEQNIKNGSMNPDLGFELFLIEVSQA